jgi:hypothetical protein
MRAGVSIDDTGDVAGDDTIEDGGGDVADADGHGDKQDKDRKNNHDGNDVDGAILDFWVHAV